MEVFMKKIHEKKPVLFAVFWIIAYVVGMSVIESVTDVVWVTKAAVTVYGALLTVLALIFMRASGTAKEFGLCRPDIPARRMLFYIPLILIGTVNLWYGVQMNMPVADSVAYVGSMVFAGFLEEIIFRGFLFRAMCRDNIKLAFIVTSLTFGIGHIVNLFNGSGQSMFETLCQIVYACAIGFVFTAVAYYTGSIVPCIITHIIINTTSAFAADINSTISLITTCALSVISIFYGIYIIRTSSSKNKRPAAANK